MIMHESHTYARAHTLTLPMHTHPLTNSASSHCVTDHVILILVLHFIRQGAERAILGENGNSLLVAQLKRRLQ